MAIAAVESREGGRASCNFFAAARTYWMVRLWMRKNSKLMFPTQTMKRLSQRKAMPRLPRKTALSSSATDGNAHTAVEKISACCPTPRYVAMLYQMIAMRATAFQGMVSAG